MQMLLSGAGNAFGVYKLLRAGYQDASICIKLDALNAEEADEADAE